MIDSAILLSVYGAFIIGLISPGPDLVLVTALSLRQGKRAAFQAAAGIAMGVGLWVLSAAAGLGGLMQAAPELWQGIRLLSGGILIYMGARAISASIRSASKSPLAEDLAEPEKTISAPFLIGMLTNLGNPKAAVVLVGLTAVLSEAVPDRDSLMIMVLGMPALTLIWFSAVATALSLEGVRDKLLAKQRWLDLAVGIALAGVGAILIQSTPTL
jgi:threonine efflux protein